MVTWNMDSPPLTDFNINECYFSDDFFKLSFSKNSICRSLLRMCGIKMSPR